MKSDHVTQIAEFKYLTYTHMSDTSVYSESTHFIDIIME